MDNYVATFFSHYDALTFFSFLKENNIKAKLMPVPRRVSSSCGTCVSFASEPEYDLSGYKIEAVYVEKENIFELVHKY